MIVSRKFLRSTGVSFTIALVYFFSGFLSLFLLYRILCRMLTWEDAYYDSDNNPEKKCPSNSVSNLPDVHCPHDPLGIAVAKMSYRAYCLGEG